MMINNPQHTAQGSVAEGQKSPWQKWCEDILIELVLPQGLSDWISLSFKPESDARLLGELLDENPAQISWINALIKQQGREKLLESDPTGLPSHRAIAYFGKSTIRNYCVSFWIGRNILPKKKSESFKLDISKLLKFTLQFQTWAEEKKFPHLEEGFRAALLFDRTISCFSQIPQATWDEAWKRSLRLTETCLEFAKRFSQLGLQRYLFVVPLLEELGSIVYSHVFTNREINLEKENSPLKASDISALMARAIPKFGSIELVLRFINDPFAISLKMREDKDLAFLIWIFKTKRTIHALGPFGRAWVKEKGITLGELEKKWLLIKST